MSAMKAPPRTVSKPNSHPADGMTIHVPVGDGAVMEIVDPRSFRDGGPEWVMRYGNVESIRYTVASLLESYDYLLDHSITITETIRRLKIMRQYRRVAIESVQEGSIGHERIEHAARAADPAEDDGER